MWRAAELCSLLQLVLTDMRIARAGVFHFGATMTAEEREIESSLHAVAIILLAMLGLAHGATRLRIPLIAKPCGAALLVGLLFAGQMAEG
mmetsp:Transcript_12725/g.38890  ORF Transcript_12725/g.38890 Transcript_12725/m.38890 type:complete len:90 (-) Transcript_12725:798-1067(-)